MIEEYIIEQLKKENLTFLARIEVSMKYNNKFKYHRSISPELLNTLNHKIRLLPLYGGNIDGNCKYQILVCLQNSKWFSGEWKDFGSNKRIKLRFFNDNIDLWLYQRRKYFGWRESNG